MLKVFETGNFSFSINTDHPLNMNYQGSDFNLKTGKFLSRRQRKPLGLPNSTAHSPRTTAHSPRPNAHAPLRVITGTPTANKIDRSAGTSDSADHSFHAHVKDLYPRVPINRADAYKVDPVPLRKKANNSEQKDFKMNTNALRNLVESMLAFDAQPSHRPPLSSASSSVFPINQEQPETGPRSLCPSKEVRMAIRGKDHLMHSYRFRVDSIRQEFHRSLGSLGFRLHNGGGDILGFATSSCPKSFGPGDVFTVIAIIQPEPLRL